MITRIRTSLRRDEGASAVEYGLLVAAIAAIIVAIVFLLGGKVRAAFDTTCDAIGSGQNSGACP
jgi:pilus assembly protein Flp/PilA